MNTPNHPQWGQRGPGTNPRCKWTERPSVHRRITEAARLQHAAMRVINLPLDLPDLEPRPYIEILEPFRGHGYALQAYRAVAVLVHSEKKRTHPSAYSVRQYS